MATLQKEIHNGQEIEVYVAAPTETLKPDERFHNKRQRKIARGEELNGPFASSTITPTAGEVQALKKRVAELEKQVAAALQAAGLPNK